MADVLPSITETQVFAALRAFILTVVGCEVVRTQDNRVPMPKGDFVALTQVAAAALATNRHSYTVQQNEVITRPTQFTIQIDCYGGAAASRAHTISTLLRDDVGFQGLKTSGLDIRPLYAEDAHQMPLVNGEQQYEERWTFNVALQYNPAVTLAQPSATSLTITTKNVDRTYPP